METVHVVSDKLVITNVTLDTAPVAAAATVAEVPAAPAVVAAVVDATPKQNLCKACGKVIPPTGKRGRPAHLCAECKLAGKKA